MAATDASVSRRLWRDGVSGRVTHGKCHGLSRFAGRGLTRGMGYRAWGLGLQPHALCPMPHCPMGLVLLSRSWIAILCGVTALFVLLLGRCERPGPHHSLTVDCQSVLLMNSVARGLGGVFFLISRRQEVLRPGPLAGAS